MLKTNNCDLCKMQLMDPPKKDWAGDVFCNSTSQLFNR